MRLSLVLSLFLSACGPRIVQLHPVTGDTFSLAPLPPPREPFGPFDGTDGQRFDALVARWRERLDDRRFPGGAIAIVLDGRLRFSAGIGTREVGHEAPVEPTTRFRTASITKMLIAATVLSLVEEGTLALDRPLVDYLSSFRRAPGNDPAAVTLAMLLDHTGGIPDSTYCPDGASLETTISMHARDPYWAPPGLVFDYSNAGYALLAAAIESATGRRFEDVVAERVLGPAGMSSAGFEASPDEPALARGHGGGHVIWTHPLDCEASRAAGGVVASVLDFAHFAETILAGGGAMLSSTSVESMATGRALVTTEPLSRYGFGVFETEHDGLRTIQHGGFAAGFTSEVRIVPERGFAVVVFTNGTIPPDDVALAAMSAFLGTSEASDRVPAPPSRFAEYAGTYEDPAGALGRLEVLVDGDALLARFLGGQGEIVPHAGVTFVRGPSGEPAWLVSRVGIAHRIE